MRHKLFLLLVLTAPLIAIAQSPSNDLGTCFGKANKKSITHKMDKFMSHLSEETGCPKDKITYSIDEYYTTFYSKPCRQLPKIITVDAGGEKRTYYHNGLSGAVLYWLLGGWSMNKNQIVAK